MSSRKSAVIENLAPKIAHLEEHLARLTEHPHIGNIRGRGLIRGLELVRNRATGEPYEWSERRGHRACVEARRHGVLLRPLGNTLVIFPPLAVSLKEMDQLIAALERGIAAAVV
ncbi:MAG: aminotransferase class III-fold pyridoxal phosphate-dependent enzyme [Pirellulales bacterium]